MKTIFSQRTGALTVLAAFLLLCVTAPAGSVNFKTCYARWGDTELVIGNSHIERKWRIQNGLLTATSLRDISTGIEWIREPAKRPAPIPGDTFPEEARVLTVNTKTGRAAVTEEESLVLELTATGQRTFSYRFQIFPDARGIGIRFHGGEGAAGKINANPASDQSAAERLTGVESSRPKKAINTAGDSLEHLLLAPQHLRFTQIHMLDRTDAHSELVFENEWLVRKENPLEAPGNVFFVENPESGAGLIFVKFAPLPHARPEPTAWDARMTGSARELRFAGQGYQFALLAYSGGRAGRIETLQTYQRQLRRYVPGRDGLFLSNTWGDRSRDARINETFMLKEIEAGAKLGVEVIQIDDGWQKGVSANSSRGEKGRKGAWASYWDKYPDFWDIDTKRFPRGMTPLVALAKENGAKLGLWFSPDSTNKGAYWQRDADFILKMHREEGIDYFKVDGVRTRSVEAEANIRRFFTKVLENSDGKIVCDVDATADRRPTFFGVPDVGPIFVENRYTDYHNYWPHMTLRTLWKLAQYVDPLRLRMEFLNNTRNTDKYEGDPLAPACYTPDTLFATVMFANPLGWFEVSNLPDDYFRLLGPLVKTWKQERASMFSNTIIPIGMAPDGVCWTGFASVSKDRRTGYVLVFRELNQAAEWTVDLPLFSGSHRLTVLAGKGTAQIAANKLTVRIAEKLQYLWLRVEDDTAQAK